MKRYWMVLSGALLIPLPVRGEVHKVEAKDFYRTFSRAHPVLARIKPVDTVFTKTVDAFGRDEKHELRHSVPGKPLTSVALLSAA